MWLAIPKPFRLNNIKDAPFAYREIITLEFVFETIIYINNFKEFSLYWKIQLFSSRCDTSGCAKKFRKFNK